jgi:hypothetical protein
MTRYCINLIVAQSIFSWARRRSPAPADGEDWPLTSDLTRPRPRLLSLASRGLARRLLREGEALRLSAARRTFPNVISAVAVSHKRK